MSILCTLLAAALALAAAPLPRTAADPAGFVPSGGKLEQQESADLDRDGKADAVLLMRNEAGEYFVAVALQQPGAQSGYRLAEQNARLIPTRGEPEVELAAKPGGFEVGIALQPGAGSYYMLNTRYRFRLQRGCFQLIGYERMETHRATMDTRDVSINFLTGAVIRRTGNEESGAKKETRGKLRKNPRRCLAALNSAATFRPQ